MDLSIVELLELSFKVAFVVFVLCLVGSAFFWFLRKFANRFKNENIHYAKHERFKELDNAFNDLDNDYWSLEKRVSYLEWSITSQKEKGETMYLSDMTAQKRGPGRPKKQED
jgi:hypothetical protein